MKNVVTALIWCAVLFTPCLLMFCQGGYSVLSLIGIETDGGPYLVQVIGLIYSLLLNRYNQWLIPKWVKDKVDALVRDE